MCFVSVLSCCCCLFSWCLSFFFFFFFNDPATTEIYTLSLHDALPIFSRCRRADWRAQAGPRQRARSNSLSRTGRSEEHTSELQSLAYLVCRLLLEKKKKKTTQQTAPTKKHHHYYTHTNSLTPQQTTMI